MTHALSTTEKSTSEPSRPETTYQTTFVPRFDIWEGDNELVLYGDLPGVAPEDLNIRFENQELTIHGKVQPRHQDIQLIYNEYDIGDFHRTFTVNEMIDVDNISAELRNGVLTIRMPKAEEVRPRRIEVKAG